MISGPPGAALHVAPFTPPDDSVYRALMEKPTLLIPIPTTAAAVQAIQGGCILAGIAIRETAGAAAQFELFDGNSAGGVEALPVFLAANGVYQLQMGRDGPLFRSGIFINVTAGSIRGCLWVKY